jgi:hypothetical protein
MCSVPRFLLLVSFLATFIGCQATTPTPIAKMASITAPAKISPTPSPRSKDPPGSLYNDEILNGPLARLMRGEAVPEVVEFVCVPTGNFNLSQADDQLLFQTMCVERHPGEKVAVLHVNDDIAYRIPSERFSFKVRFWNTTVSVRILGQTKEVRLHYLDANGAIQHVPLPEQTGKEYRYSFADLTPDTIEPIGEVRTLEIER